MLDRDQPSLVEKPWGSAPVPEPTGPGTPIRGSTFRHFQQAAEMKSSSRPAAFAALPRAFTRRSLQSCIMPATVAVAMPARTGATRQPVMLTDRQLRMIGSTALLLHRAAATVPFMLQTTNFELLAQSVGSNSSDRHASLSCDHHFRFFVSS